MGKGVHDLRNWQSHTHTHADMTLPERDFREGTKPSALMPSPRLTRFDVIVFSFCILIFKA